MWAFLDDEFGRPEQLVHKITDGIRKFSCISNNDPQGLINLWIPYDLGK